MVVLGNYNHLIFLENQQFKEYLTGNVVERYALSRQLKDGKAISKINVDLKLSNVKCVHAEWIISAWKRVNSEWYRWYRSDKKMDKNLFHSPLYCTHTVHCYPTCMGHFKSNNKILKFTMYLLYYNMIYSVSKNKLN